MTYELPTTQLDPPQWATQVREIIIGLAEEGLDEYKKVRLFRVPPIPPVEFVAAALPSVQDPAGIGVAFTLEEISNYYTLDLTRTNEEFTEELLSKSAKIAREISTVVDFLIREKTKQFGFDYKRQLNRVSAIDIFTKQDGES